MIKKYFKISIILLMLLSLFAPPYLTPVNAADKTPHNESFQIKIKNKKKTYYARITYTESSNKCSSVTYVKRSGKKYPKLTGDTLKKAKNSNAGKDAKGKAKEWCSGKQHRNTNKSTNNNSNNNENTKNSGNDSGGGNGNSSTSSSPASTDVCSSDSVPDSIKASSGCSGSDDELPNTIESILNSVILFSSLVSVAYIIVGGVQYISSSGDPGKIQKAKNTILYACIGLIICALSFAIVNFVIIDLLK